MTWTTGTQPRRSIGFLALLALLALVAGCSSEPTYADADPGQCVREGSANGDDMSVVDCGDAEAKWVVVAQVEDASDQACAGEPDTDIYISDSEAGSSTCLRFQAAEGDCVWLDLSGYADDCAEDSGYQLVAILTDATDDTGCPEETYQSRVYSDGVVYCWAQHSA